MNKRDLRAIARMLALASAVASATLPAQANERHDPNNPDFPNLALPGILNGEAAIRNLGKLLPDVALSYGKSPDELRGLLRADPTLHVDETGRLLYIDQTPPEAVDSTQSGAVLAAAAPYPLANTFLLHSRPGARRVIYLDFDGHVLTGTAWNSGKASTINCPPWDIDGSPSTFGDTERTRIQGIWQRVAEDYLPFDVDVTTEYPGEAVMTRSDLSDEIYGVRALISPISSYFGNYGGIAYVGVFDYTGDFYKPALIFPENLANGEKYIAEAVSHEVGHTLGLSHDGTTTGSAYYQGSGSGATGWAPIMGVGYYQSLTQWSKGEYSSANNKEDDLAVMLANGINYRADDHGNSISLATQLPVSSSINAAGLIERNTDVDYFAFAAQAGVVTINVAPAVNSPNLDVLADLYNASGTRIATSNPLNALNASISASVSAGTYYLAVRGTGQGDPLTGYSSYGSLGAYTVTGSVSAPAGNNPPLASFTVSATSGAPGLSVTFNSTSYDPDGSIVSYQWTFGDGSSASGVTSIAHTYASAGTFTATLRVTDNGGLSSTASTVISIKAPTPVVYVKSVTLDPPLFSGGWYTDKAYVTVVNGSGLPVANATVTGNWSGAVSGSATALTSSTGVASFTSKRYKKNNSITFTVTGVSASGYVYDSQRNLATRASR